MYILLPLEKLLLVLEKKNKGFMTSLKDKFNNLQKNYFGNS
jgi:hypothetical protein